MNLDPFAKALLDQLEQSGEISKNICRNRPPPALFLSNTALSVLILLLSLCPKIPSPDLRTSISDPRT